MGKQIRGVEIALLVSAGLLGMAVLSSYAEMVAGFVVVVGAVLIYMIPTAIAFSRNTTIRGIVSILNVFLGWTIIGWIIALALAMGPTEKPNATV